MTVRHRIISPLVAILMLNVCAVLARAAGQAVAPDASLIVNGGFRALDAKGRPTGWRLAESGVRVVTDGGVSTLLRFLCIFAAIPQKVILYGHSRDATLADRRRAEK